MASHDPYAALRHRDFRLLIIARVANTISFLMLDTIVGWQVYALTHDPLSLGFIGLFTAIPAITVSLYAGHLSDRKNRRVIALWSFAVLLLCNFIFLYISLHLDSTYYHWGTMPFYATVFLGGLASGFLGPAASAFGSQLIPEEAYANASAWRSSSWQAGAIAGPAIGGLIYGFSGAAMTYGVGAILLSIGMLCFFLIPNRPLPIHNAEESIRDSLKQGIRFVFNNQVIVGALSLDLFAVLFGGAVALLPAFAHDILKIGPIGLGLLRAAPSVGAVLTALWMAHRQLHRRVGMQLFIAVLGFGITTIIFALSKSVVLSLVMLALGGAFDSVSVIIRSTLLQLSTPNEMRGRVEAVNMMFIGSSNEIGAFESGVAARLTGLIPSVIFGGSMTLVSVFTTARLTPILRKLKYEELIGHKS